MELGKTIVEVIIKKMSNRKMTSVIDAMLNVASILCLRFSAMVVSPSGYSAGSLSRSINSIVLDSSWFITPSTRDTR